MLKELLILGALGAGTFIVVDPTARNAVAGYISKLTNAQQTSQQTSQQSQPQSIGIGTSFMDYIKQLFANQQQLENQISALGGGTKSTSVVSSIPKPAPVIINYPSQAPATNPANSTNTTNTTPQNTTTTPFQAAMNVLNYVTTPKGLSALQSQPVATQLAVQSALLSTYNPNTGQQTSVASIPASSNPILSSAAAARNQALINTNNYLNQIESANPAYASIIAARETINAEREANLLPA
ncbi:MAG: hypothetical protein QXH07_07405 [Thermoplasmata archaeon]